MGKQLVKLNIFRVFPGLLERHLRLVQRLSGKISGLSITGSGFNSGAAPGLFTSWLMHGTCHWAALQWRMSKVLTRNFLLVSSRLSTCFNWRATEMRCNVVVQFIVRMYYITTYISLGVFVSVQGCRISLLTRTKEGSEHFVFHVYFTTRFTPFHYQVLLFHLYLLNCCSIFLVFWFASNNNIIAFYF